LKWPPPPIITSASEGKTNTAPTTKKPVEVVDTYKEAWKSALTASCAIMAALSVGYVGPHPEFLKMLNTFVLSGIVGY